MADNEDWETEKTKIQLASCVAHGLKYDPAATWGCVLCRKNERRRIRWYLVVGLVLILLTAAYLCLWDETPPCETAQRLVVAAPSTVSSTDSTTDTPEHRITEDECRRSFFVQIEECIADAPKDNRIDQEMCLAPLESLGTRCSPAGSEPTHGAEAPLYNMGPMPSWTEVREPFERHQHRIEDCTQDARYRFAARVAVTGATGRISFATLSLFGLTDSSRYCVYRLMDDLTMPSAPDDYTVVFMVDSQVLSLNPPEEDKPDEDADFKRFVQQQRQSQEAMERRQKKLEDAEQKRQLHKERQRSRQLESSPR